MDTETLNQLLMFVVAGLIIPIVNGLRNTWLVNYIRPEFLAGLMAIGAAWGLTTWLIPGMPVQEWLMLGLAAAGVTNMMHGGVKLTQKKENGQ